MSDVSNKNHRPIRSYVRRSGRLTRAQARALDTLWPGFAIEPIGLLDFAQGFGRDAPTFVEIGFGMGSSLAQMASQRPQHNFLGIEVYQPGIGSLLAQIDDSGLKNIRLINADAMEVLRDHIAACALAGVYLFFPDPWHKKRHHKRRLVQPTFIQLVAERLQNGGILHMATDWQAYAEQMLEVASACPSLKNDAGAGNYSPQRVDRLETKFERRGQRLGHAVWDLVFSKITP